MGDPWVFNRTFQIFCDLRVYKKKSLTIYGASRILRFFTFLESFQDFFFSVVRKSSFFFLLVVLVNSRDFSGLLGTLKEFSAILVISKIFLGFSAVKNLCGVCFYFHVKC